jgi:hypothetical protein
VAEGVGFEPTLGLPLSLISSQVPSTTQPPFQPEIGQSISHVCPLGASRFGILGAFEKNLQLRETIFPAMSLTSHEGKLNSFCFSSAEKTPGNLLIWIRKSTQPKSLASFLQSFPL